jgi:GNAT superfamily N-acetyltransferase
VSTVEYLSLEPALRPLLNKFYRSHGSAMRTSSGAALWVAREVGIVAVLNLRPVSGGQWLTGLLVAPEQRGKGLATQLMAHALHQADSPTWLFCHPELASLYQRNGFNETEDLPASLEEKLLRYQRTKALIAMLRPAG